mmetsp:Transcript_27783/g.73375  ORF Transcript_27783/g.73375 Transcript_27783/m.73375 type:complete len:129 (+) Transcript_27783:537-923(+)
MLDALSTTLDRGHTSDQDKTYVRQFPTAACRYQNLDTRDLWWEQELSVPLCRTLELVHLLRYILGVCGSEKQQGGGHEMTHLGATHPLHPLGRRCLRESTAARLTLCRGSFSKPDTALIARRSPSSAI